MTLFRRALLLIATLTAVNALAVQLEPNGIGQALIFPYYTARVVDGNAWTTALSLTNSTDKAKIVKLRFREGKHGRLVMEANVYLGATDMWTGAVIAESDGAAHLISADFSCMDPAHSGVEVGAFSTASFTGTNDDGAGLGVDRTLEGYAEAIEMGTLGDPTAAAITFGASGLPTNCASVVGPGKIRTVLAPEGGLAGMAYQLNINNGLVTSYRAVALANLTREPFYSDVGAAGTDFDSPQVTPLSIVAVPSTSASGFGTSPGGYLLSSSWSRGVDAVSAVLMASTIVGDYVLDNATRSNTDWMVTFPTARFYNAAATATAPFSQTFAATGACERFDEVYFNRDQQGSPSTTGVFFPEPPPPPPPPVMCWTSNALIWRNGTDHAYTTGWTASSVLGSANFNSAVGTNVNTTFPNGFAAPVIAPGGPGLTSLPASTAIELATGNIVTGAHTFQGLPIVGFAAWKYENGLLSCSGQACMGNFGVAIPFHPIQAVTRTAP